MGSPVLCGKCSTWVCSSRVTKRPDGEYFQCRASCNSKGMLIETDEGYSGSKNSTESSGAKHRTLVGAKGLALQRRSDDVGLAKLSVALSGSFPGLAGFCCLCFFATKLLYRFLENSTH
jgi:hypothetical protein